MPPTPSLHDTPPMVRRRLTDRILPRGGGGPAVTVVLGPRGSGKTSLLRSLRGVARPEDGPLLYLSLADAEHHPALLLDLLAAAVRAELPRADLRPLLLLKSAAPGEEYGVRLPYVLARVLEPHAAGPAALLLDDVDATRPDEPLASLVGGLLRAEPRRLRCVLAARSEPPLDLATWRHRGELLEVGAPDLAFTAEEVMALARHAGVGDLGPAAAARVVERTRGWAGLVAGLLDGVRDAPEDGVLAALAAAEEGLDGAWLGELLGTLRPPLRYFAKVASVLDRVEPAAVEALFRGGPARGLIALPVEEIPSYLAELEAAQVLSPSPADDGALEFNPALGAALRRQVEREVPRVSREAHRRLAHWLLEGGRRPDASVVDHLLAAGDHEQVLAILEREAERFFAEGAHRALTRWLEELERRYATLPFWASYYLGRLRAAAGDWDAARALLDRCKQAVGADRSRDDAWRWQPRLCIGYGTMYWQRGMHAEANTYCRRGLDFLEQLRRRGDVGEAEDAEAARIELELLALRARVAMETGVYDKAREASEAARALSRRHGLARQEAEALRSLGLIATRRGDVEEANRLLHAALERVDADSEPELHAAVAYHLALNHVVVGEPSAALARVRDAVGHAVASGSADVALPLLAHLGQLAAEAGHEEEAAEAFAQVDGLLDEAESVKARVVALDRLAIARARSGRAGAARRALDRASALADARVRGEAHAGALHLEARAEVAAAAGQVDKALAHLAAAVDRLARAGASWDVARLAWRAAGWHHRRFVAEEEETPEAVLAEVARAVSLAVRHGYALPDGATPRDLLHVGVGFGDDEVRTWCAARLAGLGEDPVDERGGLASEGAVARYRDYRRRAELADDYVVTTRDASRGLNARQLDELVEGRGEEALVVIEHEQRLVNRGAETSLAEKRVILPLLLHFLRHPDRAFTMAELADEVWGTGGDSGSMQTKVKVAISRLRALLGKDREYILTERAETPDGASVVAYRLADDLEYYVVSPHADSELP